MRGRALLNPLPLLPILIVLLAATSPLTSGARYTLTLEGEYKLPLPNNTRITCVYPLGPDDVLLAGSTGAPPRAFAAVYDVNASRVEPLVVTGLEGSIRSEITGCTRSDIGPLLYGYVQLDNATYQTVLWVYTGGELRAYPLKSRKGGIVLGVPYFLAEYSGVYYLTTFLGDCDTKGTMSIAYVLIGGLSKILQGDFEGYTLILAFNASKEGIYQRVGREWYRCVYLTGVYQLATGDVVLLGYALNKTRIKGFSLEYDALLQVLREGVRETPMIPVALAKSGPMAVAIGASSVDPRKPAVMLISLDGTRRSAEISYTGFDSVYLYHVDCLVGVCVASGYASVGGKRIGMLALIGVNNTVGKVEYAELYKWSRVSDVQAVSITPRGEVYAVGSAQSGELHLIKARLVAPGAGVASGSRVAQSGGAASWPMLVAVAGFIAALVLVIVFIARRKR